jgi:hypothetical protein
MIGHFEETIDVLKFVSIALFAVALATPAIAQDEPIDQRLVTLFGASEPFAEAFEAIQTAVGNEDSGALGEWIAYPLRTMISGEETEIGDPESFMANYDFIVTPEVADAVMNQEWDTLFANADGVMFGDGQVWMTMICTDDACTNSEVKIITIQGAE